MVLGDVELQVNLLWHGLDLSLQLTFNVVQIEAVFISDEVNSQTQVTKPARATDTVQVGLGSLWEVKVYHDIHSLDVNPSRQKI